MKTRLEQNATESSLPQAIANLPAREPWTPLKIVLTFHLVALVWIFFRAPTLSSALLYFKGLLLGPDRAPSSGPPQIIFNKDLVWVGAAALALLLLIDLPQYLTRNSAVLLRLPLPMKALVLGLLTTWLLLAQGEPSSAFIYFQF